MIGHILGHLAIHMLHYQKHIMQKYAEQQQVKDKCRQEANKKTARYEEQFQREQQLKNTPFEPVTSFIVSPTGIVFMTDEYKKWKETFGYKFKGAGHHAPG